MNRRHALLASLLLLLPGHAEVVTTDLAFATHVNDLPACDRVEVLRLADKIFTGEEKAPDPEKLTAKEKERFYCFKFGENYTWFKITGKVTLKNAEAERIAGLFRAVKQYYFAPGVGASFCHSPPYLYRFYSGDKLLGEASVCWECHNLIVGPPDKRTAMYFKKNEKEVKQLP